MFRHVVMFKWSEDATDPAKKAISAALDDLGKLDVIQKYQHGPDAGISDGNWDYVVVGDFENIGHYQSYAGDAEHQRIIAELIKPNISARAAVQYQVS